MATLLFAVRQVSDCVRLFAELYTQSRTSPGQGAGYRADGGLQYMCTPDVELDTKVRLRLSGSLGGWARYLGVGLTILF